MRYAGAVLEATRFSSASHGLTDVSHVGMVFSGYRSVHLRVEKGPIQQDGKTKSMCACESTDTPTRGASSFTLGLTDSDNAQVGILGVWY